jgi:hypothetical protein
MSKGTRKEPYLTTVDIALTAVFCAVYVILNLILGPLSFTLTQLPAIHTIGVFFSLIIVAWITGRYGTSSMTGIIGSILAMLISGIPVMIGFLPAAIIFDLLLIANHHKIRMSAYSWAVTAIATLVSGYIAGVVIGVIFMPFTLLVAMTFWAVWTTIGAAAALVIAFPVVGILERANVRQIKGE